MMTEILSNAEVTSKCERLIKAANDKGSPDNVTAVLLRR